MTTRGLPSCVQTKCAHCLTNDCSVPVLMLLNDRPSFPSSPPTVSVVVFLARGIRPDPTFFSHHCPVSGGLGTHPKSLLSHPSAPVSAPCPPPQQTPVLPSPCSLCLCAFAFFLCPLTKFHSSIEGVIKCPHRHEMFPSQYVPESFLALIEFPLATSFPILCFTLDSFCCILE